MIKIIETGVELNFPKNCRGLKNVTFHEYIRQHSWRDTFIQEG